MMHARLRLIASLIVLTVTTAAGSNPTLGPVVALRGSVALTADDVRTLLEYIDPTTRARLQHDPAALVEFVRGRVLQLALLQEAKDKKWDQRPDIAFRANEAHDAVVTDTYLASVTALDPAYPSDADVQSAYEANKSRFIIPRQYHIAQIYVAGPAGASNQTDDDLQKRLRALRQQASKPKVDFADLARTSSQDRATSDKGGDLGWVKEDQLVPQIKDAVAGLQAGGISEPLRLPDGWHLIKLLETKPAGVADLADVKDALIKTLRQQRQPECTGLSRRPAARAVGRGERDRAIARSDPVEGTGASGGALGIGAGAFRMVIMPASFIVLASIIVADPLLAQTSQGADGRTAQTCVDVRIGSDAYYSCLNQKLAASVPGRRSSAHDAPLTATSPAPAVGTYNQAATRERLGDSFGHSAIPQRPPPAVYTSPFVSGRP